MKNYTHLTLCKPCGAKQKKPLYKSKWFLIAAIIAVLGIINAIATDGTSVSNSVGMTMQESESTTYKSILSNYSQEMEDAVPLLLEEYQQEAENSTGSIKDLARISNAKVEALSKINQAGANEMLQLMETKGDNYHQYKEWAAALNEVYEECTQSIANAYKDSAK